MAKVEKVVACLYAADEMLCRALSHGKSESIEKIRDLLCSEIDSHTDELDALSAQE